MLEPWEEAEMPAICGGSKDELVVLITWHVRRCFDYYLSFSN